MKNNGVKYVIGLMFSVVITLALVLILSGVVKLFTVGEIAVKIINQIIKIVAILFGCIYSIRENAGLMKGLVFGALYALITLIIFGLISGGISLDKSFFIDLAYGAVIGAICGIISVNVKK